MRKSLLAFSLAFLIMGGTLQAQYYGTENNDKVALQQSMEAENSELEMEAAALADCEREAENELLLARLNEINDLDKSDLTHAEKRALRTEVKTIEAEMAANGGGIYISVGAIIIIILLLILIF
jgi:hypothetical protein